jgi:hypothetical protein
MYGVNLRTIPHGIDGCAVLKELQHRVSEVPRAKADAYLCSEHMLVRFLIAQKWDLEKASKALFAHYAWLEEKQISKMISEPFPEEPVLKRFYPMAYHGLDKLGRPIYIECLGSLNLRELMKHLSPRRIGDFFSVGAELQIRRRLPGCSIFRGELIDRSLNIIDLKGVSVGSFTNSTVREVLKDLMSISQSQYPEMTGQTIVINAPKAFSLIKPFMKTDANFSVYGSKVAEWSKVLLELVDESQLPKMFGGRCVCDGQDLMSCMRCEKGPWCDAEIMKILDTEPLDQIMSPEGARLLHHRWKGDASADGMVKVSAFPQAASSDDLGFESPGEAADSPRSFQSCDSWDDVDLTPVSVAPRDERSFESNVSLQRLPIIERLRAATGRVSSRGVTFADSDSIHVVSNPDLESQLIQNGAGENSRSRLAKNSVRRAIVLMLALALLGVCIWELYNLSRHK